MIIPILYVIYIITLIITFLVCYFLANYVLTCRNQNCELNNILVYLLIASIMALVVIFISIVWVDTSNLSDPELIALNVLVIITFLLPIILIILLVLIKEQDCCNEEIDKCNIDKDICSDNKCKII